MELNNLFVQEYKCPAFLFFPYFPYICITRTTGKLPTLTPFGVSLMILGETFRNHVIARL